MTNDTFFIRIHGLRVHYLHAGAKGPPLVLLHGGGIDSARLSWGHIIGPLAESYRVFAPDWPGYGESDRPNISYSTTLYTSVLKDFVQQLALEQTTLVGVSMGGAIALGYTLAHPQSVRKLVLVSSYGLQDRAPAHELSYLFLRVPFLNEFIWAVIARSRFLARASLKAIFYDPGKLSENLVDQVYAELNKPRTGAAFRSFQMSEVRWAGVTTQYMKQLHRLSVPTLILHGAHDTLVPLRFAEAAHDLIPKSQLRIIPNAGHWPQREQEEQFLDALRSFIEE